MNDPRTGLPDLAAALRLFDETTGALAAQVQRLESLLLARTRELVEANARLTAANRELAERLAQLDRLTAWLDLVLGSVASGVVAVDPLGVVTTCNPAAAAALSKVLSDPVGAHWATTFPGSPLLEVLRDGRPRRYERTVPGPGGKRILACSAAPVRAEPAAPGALSVGSTLLGAVEIFEDVTELRRLHDHLEREDRLRQLGAMAAGVAHEVRNPLNGIQGFASLLLHDLAGNDADSLRRRRWAEAIGAGVRDLDRTVGDLLTFTRARAPDRRPTDPGDLARAVCDLVRAEAPPQVALTLADRWQGGEVALDPGQIRQVLLNLVQNAVHAVGESRNDLGGESGPGRVVVTADQALADDGGLRLRLTVDDDGPGIAPELRQHLFTPFHSTRSQGTGLGLAIAHTLVAGHGGAISVEDGPLGGARFTVTVPA